MVSARCLFLVGSIVAALVMASTPAPAADPAGEHVHGGRYLGLKLAQVRLETAEQLDALRRLGVVILDCQQGVGPLDVVADDRQIEALGKLGVPLRIMHDDVQALVDRERRPSSGRDAFDDFFLDFHPYDTGPVNIVWYLGELTQRYPALASLVDVGTTLEGRTIWGLRITSGGGDKPAVVYFGAEHAREWVTTTAPTYFATYLLENYGGDPTVTDLVDNVEFFLIPVLNVDGFIYTWTDYRLWRKNRRDNGDGSFGVDLNRNWAEGWGGPGSDSWPDSNIYRGPAPFSEPETQVLRDFFFDHPNVRASLDIHSYSQLILWPYGYTPAYPPDQEYYLAVGTELQSLIAAVHGRYYSIGTVYHGIYPASGVSLDWTYAALDLLSYTFELRPTSGNPGFELPPDQIIPNNQEILPALLYVADSEWVRAAIRIETPFGLPTTMTTGAETPVIVKLFEQTEAIVPGSAVCYYRYAPGATFSQAPFQDIGSNIYWADLPATNCWAAPEFYISVTGDGGTVQTYPRGAPADGTLSAIMESFSGAFYTESLDLDPGWQTEGDWAFGQPTGGGGAQGGPDPSGGHLGGNVYGYNLNGDYASDLPELHLTGPAIDCTGQTGVTLVYYRWLGVGDPAADRAEVQVSNDGANWVTVWENTAEVTDYGWVRQELDISAVADDQATVTLRWTMGATDGGLQYCGWNIDDVRLTSVECQGIRGDHDGGGTIDLADYAAFEPCLTGPAGGVPPGCTVFDFFDDLHIDLADYAAFQAAYDGF
ncbi:MAG: hypothetical protein IID40_00990 [Planctomycetes bacterium]|nr:hypothetical protein [Planctomycetota bacterium]